MSPHTGGKELVRFTSCTRNPRVDDVWIVAPEGSSLLVPRSAMVEPRSMRSNSLIDPQKIPEHTKRADVLAQVLQFLWAWGCWRFKRLLIVGVESQSEAVATWGAPCSTVFEVFILMRWVGVKYRNYLVSKSLRSYLHCTELHWNFTNQYPIMLANDGTMLNKVFAVSFYHSGIESKKILAITIWY